MLEWWRECERGKEQRVTATHRSVVIGLRQFPWRAFAMFTWVCRVLPRACHPDYPLWQHAHGATRAHEFATRQPSIYRIKITKG
jgi:hypothetical protein